MIVLDSCAAVEMARNTIEGQALRQFLLNRERVVSCDLIRAELASVFRKSARTEGISAQQAESYLTESLKLVDEFCPIEELQTEALYESIRLDHSVYDMFYFVLARRTGATLFTLDCKLMKLCKDNGVNCIAEIAL